ncbi:GAF domain-containing protein [Sphaerimonospora mesophila]|uniref:GAF domain-containing protein n=1 Tax=Sphaerimonospora mesophila TaxID=37483 RepID=UPI000AC8A888
MRRLRERVVPALEALLQAARDRMSFGHALQASRDELRWIAQEQAALRRVATLVARGASTTEMFNGIAGEMGPILQAPCTMIGRYEPDETLVVVGSWSGDSPGNALPLGSRWPLEGESIPVIVLETGRAVHITNYADATWKMARWARERGYFAAIGTPILVDGGLWGVLKAFYHVDEDAPDHVDEHMLELTELVTIAISSAPAASARRRLRILSDAAMGIGQTLDVVRTAEDLAQATVSRFADLVTVDLAESVLRGQDVGDPSAGIRRVVVQDTGDNSDIMGPLGQEVQLPFPVRAGTLPRGKQAGAVARAASRHPIPHRRSSVRARQRLGRGHLHATCHTVR